MLIFLIGFMGAGKTTVGKKLAEILEFKFIDTDEFIGEHYEESPAHLIKEGYEKKLRFVERKAIKTIIENFNNAVIAVGGGAPCFYDNMKMMNDAGETIYLCIKFDILWERISKDSAERPLIKNKKQAKKLLEERKFYYDYAHNSFKVEKGTIDEVAGAIAEHIKFERLGLI